MQRAELDLHLSSLGMLSEPFTAHCQIEEEERELLRNKPKLATLAAKNRKEAEKKQYEKAKKELTERKEEKESKKSVYSRYKLDAKGNKVGKSKNLFGPKKPRHDSVYNDYDDYDDEEDYQYSMFEPQPKVRVERLYSTHDDETEEQELLDMVLAMSKSSYEQELEEKMSIECEVIATIPTHVRDIRCCADIEIGMFVEIFLIGQEDSRQRTIGNVQKIISSSPMLSKGALVELEYGIIGHVTGLIHEEYIPTQFSLSNQQDNEEESEDEALLWVDDSVTKEKSGVNREEDPFDSLAPTMCPGGCGVDLVNFSVLDTNKHLDECLAAL